MKNLISFIWYSILLLTSIICIITIMKNFDFNKSAIQAKTDLLNMAIEQLSNNN